MSDPVGVVAAGAAPVVGTPGGGAGVPPAVAPATTAALQALYNSRSDTMSVYEPSPVSMQHFVVDSGSTFGVDRSHDQGAVWRMCHMRVSYIEIISKTDIPRSVVLSVTMRKSKGRVLRTPPITLLHPDAAPAASMAPGVSPRPGVSVDIQFSFRYMHTFVDAHDVLFVRLQPTEGKNRRGAILPIYLSEVLQSPMDDEVVLNALVERKEGRWKQWARLQLMVGSYPEHVASHGEAQDWEYGLLPEGQNPTLSDDDDDMFDAAVAAYSGEYVDDFDEFAAADPDSVPDREKEMAASAPQRPTVVPSVSPLVPTPSVPVQVASPRTPGHRSLSVATPPATPPETPSKKMSSLSIAALGEKKSKKAPKTGKKPLWHGRKQSGDGQEGYALPGYSSPSSSDVEMSDDNEDALAPFATGSFPTPRLAPECLAGSLPTSSQAQLEMRSAAESIHEGTLDSSCLALAHTAVGSAPQDVRLCVFLADGTKRRPRKLIDMLERPGGPLRSGERSCTCRAAVTRNTNDVVAVMSASFERFQTASEEPVRMFVVGSDRFLCEVMRQFLDLLSKKPRDWDPVLFHLLPLGKRNDIAENIAASDSEYRAHFCSDEWRAIFDKREPASADECASVMRSVCRYMDDASSVCRMDLGEALLTLPGAAQRALPFLHSIQVFCKEEADVPVAESTLDYWTPKKEKEKKADAHSGAAGVSTKPPPEGSHHQNKSPLSSLVATRLPSVARSLRLERENMPTPDTLSVLMLIKSKSKAVMKALTKIGDIISGKKDQSKKDDSSDNERAAGRLERESSAALKKDKSRSDAACKDIKDTVVKDTSAGGTKDKPKDKDRVEERKAEFVATTVTKLFCSTEGGLLRIVVDGSEVCGVQMVALKTNSGSARKTFGVQTFAAGVPISVAAAAPQMAASYGAHM
eukprot:m51a1_g11375 hypothetical protein (917) ;mRNA; f:23991-27295